MAQNLGDVVTIKNFYAENGFVAGNVNGVGQEFESYTLIANQQMTLSGEVVLNSDVKDPRFFSYITFECPKIIIDNSGNGIAISLTNNSNKLTFSNASVNFDKAIYMSAFEGYNGPISFSGSSSINITPSTVGKRIIKASVLTGTVTLDIENGVRDGDTFSIEATTNNLIIENAEGYEVTSESVGNVTTYTVSIASATKEVKELEVGGVVYPIKDEVARTTKQDLIEDLDSIRTNSNLGAVASSELPAVRQTADEANALAKNAQQGVSFANYQAMVNNVNAYAYDKFIIGQSIYIGTKEVPDLWVYAKYQEAQPYTYTTDDAIVEALKAGTLRVGRYELAALETGKVNITNVVTTDTAQTITGTKTFESRIYYGSDRPERELPEGYTQLKWVNVAGGSTGANKVYLDTGIKIDHTIEFDVFYEYNNVGVGVASGQGVVMGARVSSSSWVCTVSGYSTFPTGYFGFNNNVRSQAYLMVGNNHISFRTPDDNPNVGVYTCVNENGTNTYQINRVSGYPATAPTLTLGCLHDGSNFSENLNGKIYYAKIWKNGELVRDYIPCISDLTGEVGFYDFVSNTFNKSATNVPFGAGDGYVDQFALLSEVRGAVAGKQNRLTAGTNISIVDDKISATIPSTYVTTNTAQTISGNKNFTGTLQKSGVAVATTTDVSTAVNNHNQDAESHSDIRADIDVLDKRIDEIQLFKFPNAIIRGEPTIQNGQIGDFSVVSYLQFPFLIDFQDNSFQIDFCFTTATNVQTQQNIIDSNFGIALAIANGKGLMAISSNGTSWNIGSSVGAIDIQPNTTYYARLSWNKLQYKTFLSTDGVNYTQDMVLVGATRPYPRTAFIGGCNQEETGHTPHPFLGTINMNKAFLYVNNQLIWQGMDDAGLATRADISLSNLDADGEARFTAKQDVINDLEAIRSGATAGSTALQSITSANVTDALGYTPYNSTNPAGYTSNVGTVTSVNNVQPVNGNVSISVGVTMTYDSTTETLTII